MLKLMRLLLTLIILTVSLVLHAAEWYPLQRAELYGCPWGADSLGNLEIGKAAGRKVAYRFVAGHTGTVEKLVIFLVFRAPGYYKGDGGQVLAEIRSDDGTDKHLPSGTVLGSCLIENPMFPTHPWSGTGVGYPELRFDRAVSLEQGRLYHVVFTNPAPDPISNYVSIDDLYRNRREPNMQPGVSDLELAVLYKYSVQHDWEVNYAHTPIFCVAYADGFRQGQGYVNARSQSGLCRIGGAYVCREVFTVSGQDRTVRAATVRLRKTGSPGPLAVRLEDASGAAIGEGSVPAEAIGTESDWVSCRFATDCALKSGRQYALVLAAPQGDPYEIFPLQKGIPHGFGCPQIFADGWFESTDDATYNGSKHDVDMQFYLTAVPACGSIPVDANLDCRTNILDLIFIRNRLNLSVWRADAWQADVNRDGAVNILDLIDVRNRMGGTENDE